MIHVQLTASVPHGPLRLPVAGHAAPVAASHPHGSSPWQWFLMGAGVTVVGIVVSRPRVARILDKWAPRHSLPFALGGWVFVAAGVLILIAGFVGLAL